MTDILHILPDLDTSPYCHILPSLERSLVTVDDILILDPINVAKRASVPSAEVRKLREAVVAGLQSQLKAAHDPLDGPRSCGVISTLDRDLDGILGGGIPAGHLIEITGESAAGKTQLLLSLCLAAQLPTPHGLSRSVLYITTEAPLQTGRLAQILRFNPLLDSIAPPFRPSLSRIHSIKVSDLESQEHILQYQVPVAIARHDVGLIVIDSIAANFRAEFDLPTTIADKRKGKRLAFDQRNAHLNRLGAHLRSLAREHYLAVVVANQVLDRFTPPNDHVINPTPASQLSRTSSSQHMPVRASPQSTPVYHDRPPPDRGPLEQQTQEPELILSTPDPLSLDHQIRFTTGWGDLLDRAQSHVRSHPVPETNKPDSDSTATPGVSYTSHATHRLYHEQHPKTPALGHTWTGQLSARIVLLKSPVYRDHDWRLGIRERDVVRWRRGIKVVFASWTDGRDGSAGDAGGDDGADDEGVDGVGDGETYGSWVGNEVGIGGIGKEVEIWEGGMRVLVQRG